MNQSKNIGVRDLVVGGHYLHRNELFVRTIDSIEGDRIRYHDQHGPGWCSKKVFMTLCVSKVDGPAAPYQKSPEATNVHALIEEFTIRDEANALTAFAFRNGFLEDLHAGKSSPILEQPGYSRITDEEMRKLMIEASTKLMGMLKLKSSDPEKYDEFIRNYQKMYCLNWNRD